MFLNIIPKSISILMENNFFSLPNAPKPEGFTSLPLQSSIFSINTKLIPGLVSSVITAAIGYVIRLFVLKYFQHDLLTNIDN